jgi:hypothetical protein
MTRTRTIRRAVVALAGAALIGLAMTPAAAAADPVPTFDFADCPAIPGGADPAQWRCEVLMSTGAVTFGTIAELPVGAMRMTFAEGQLNGEYAQVFGALRADPVRVPGGLLGTGDRNPLLRMDIRLEYAGFADFHSDGDRMGEQHLKIRVISGLLPATCTIGSDDDPIVLKPIRTSGPDVISTDPPVLRFTIEDTAFATPRAHGCGGLDRLVNKRFGLPAPAGTNAMTLTTTVGLRSYTQI